MDLSKRVKGMVAYKKCNRRTAKYLIGLVSMLLISAVSAEKECIE